MKHLLVAACAASIVMSGCSTKPAPRGTAPTYSAPLPNERPAPPPPPPTAAAPHPHELAREFLPSSASEQPGFGLYSYVLFGYPPLDPNDRTSEQYQRYLKTAENFVQIDQVGDVLRAGAQPANINITYFPVSGPPAANTAQALLMAYDYARAHVILQLTGKSSQGPYIVSTLKPLSQASSFPDQHILQDLSEVPPRLVGLWVQNFREQSTQSRFWEQPRDEYALKLRTEIGEVSDQLIAAVVIWHFPARNR